MNPAPFPIPLMLAEADPAALGEALALLFVGMLVVLVALTLIASAVGLLTNLLRPEPPTPPPPPEPETGTKPGPDRRTIAVLAAAASVACGRAVSIRRVTVLGRQTHETWVTGGRATLLGSHTPRMLR